MERKKLLILSVSAGAGHLRAAEAIRTACEKNYPDVQAVHIDVMDFVSKLFRKSYAESYIKIVNTDPALWGYLYDRMDRIPSNSLFSKFVRTLDRLNLQKMKKFINESKPDAVICTHFLPVELLTRMSKKGKFSHPIWIQITDFDVHTLWIHDWITGYFCPNEEVALRLADRGIDKDKIFVTGIPIMPAFSEPLRREDFAREVGADPKKLTFLMMAGGFGVGGMDILAEKILNIEGNFQVIAIAGKNEKLLKILKEKKEKYPSKIFPIGFTNTIERAMAASDAAITKAGGLTVSECLAMQLPMVLISAIPGQEERNATYLLENGAALRAYDAAGLEYRIRMLLKHPDRLKIMRDNTNRIRRPNAANDALNIVMR